MFHNHWTELSIGLYQTLFPRSGDVIHPQLWESGSGYETRQRVHVDFAGPLCGKMFFLLMDAHSKWPEVYEMTSTTALKTIEILRYIFAS